MFNLTMQIIFENKDVVVVNKPAGLLVHGIFHKGYAKHNEETLTNWLVANYPEIKNVGDAPEMRPGIVHRLDRETSGVLVAAKNNESFNFLKNLFKTQGIKKTYLALVWGAVKKDKGIINKPISIVDGSVRRTVHRGKMRRDALTEYEVVKRLMHPFGEFTLLKVSPHTGRTHQIRVHLASIGHPIVGDKVYGKFKEFPGIERHFLHADSLELPLPDGKRMRLSADLPQELKTILDSCQTE